MVGPKDELGNAIRGLEKLAADLDSFSSWCWYNAVIVAMLLLALLSLCNSCKPE